jgi:hypothetical protein
MINIFAIIVIAVIYWILGALWYSKVLFGNLWMKSIGKTEDELEMKASSFIGSAIISFMIPLFLAMLLELIGTINLFNGILLALIVWIGFDVSFGLYDVLYGDKNIKTYLIDSLYHLAGLLIAGIILGLWVLQ